MNHLLGLSSPHVKFDPFIAAIQESLNTCNHQVLSLYTTLSTEGKRIFHAEPVKRVSPHLLPFFTTQTTDHLRLLSMPAATRSCQVHVIFKKYNW